MPTEHSPNRRRALLIGVPAAVIVVAGAGALARAASDSGRSDSAASHPAAAGATTMTTHRFVTPAPAGPLTPTPTSTEAAPARATSTIPTARAGTLTIRPGVPVAIDIPIASSNHPNGVHTSIDSHRLNPDGTLFVPADPTRIAWASQDAAPGSSRGTAILVSHINYVINGRAVAGAFSDLAEYAQRAIGRHLRVHLVGGRTLTYVIVRGREYKKQELASQPQLRRVLYNQTESFGRGTGRLLLVSCGGAFDPSSGEYEDNVFLYAMPVG